MTTSNSHDEDNEQNKVYENVTVSHYNRDSGYHSSSDRSGHASDGDANKSVSYRSNSVSCSDDDAIDNESFPHEIDKSERSSTRSDSGSDAGSNREQADIDESESGDEDQQETNKARVTADQQELNASDQSSSHREDANDLAESDGTGSHGGRYRDSDGNESYQSADKNNSQSDGTESLNDQPNYESRSEEWESGKVSIQIEFEKDDRRSSRSGNRSVASGSNGSKSEEYQNDVEYKNDAQDLQDEENYIESSSHSDAHNKYSSKSDRSVDASSHSELEEVGQNNGIFDSVMYFDDDEIKNGEESCHSDNERSECDNDGSQSLRHSEKREAGDESDRSARSSKHSEHGIDGSVSESARSNSRRSNSVHSEVDEMPYASIQHEFDASERSSTHSESRSVRSERSGQSGSNGSKSEISNERSQISISPSQNCRPILSVEDDNSYESRSKNDDSGRSDDNFNRQENSARLINRNTGLHDSGKNLTVEQIKTNELRHHDNQPSKVINNSCTDSNGQYRNYDNSFISNTSDYRSDGGSAFGHSDGNESYDSATDHSGDETYLSKSDGSESYRSQSNASYSRDEEVGNDVIPYERDNSDGSSVCSENRSNASRSTQQSGSYGSRSEISNERSHISRSPDNERSIPSAGYNDESHSKRSHRGNIEEKFNGSRGPRPQSDRSTSVAASPLASTVVDEYNNNSTGKYNDSFVTTENQSDGNESDPLDEISYNSGSGDARSQSGRSHSGSYSDNEDVEHRSDRDELDESERSASYSENRSFLSGKSGQSGSNGSRSQISNERSHVSRSPSHDGHSILSTGADNSGPSPSKSSYSASLGSKSNLSAGRRSTIPNNSSKKLGNKQGGTESRNEFADDNNPSRNRRSNEKHINPNSSFVSTTSDYHSEGISAFSHSDENDSYYSGSDRSGDDSYHSESDGTGTLTARSNSASFSENDKIRRSPSSDKLDKSGRRSVRSDNHSIASGSTEQSGTKMSGSENEDELEEHEDEEEQQEGSMLMPAVKQFFGGYTREQIMKLKEDIEEQNMLAEGSADQHKLSKRVTPKSKKSDVLIELLFNVAKAMPELDEHLKLLAEMSKDEKDIEDQQQPGTTDGNGSIPVTIQKATADEDNNNETSDSNDQKERSLNNIEPNVEVGDPEISMNGFAASEQEFPNNAETVADQPTDKEAEAENSDSEEMQLTSTRLMFCFEAITGILLRFSDELDLLSTFAKRNESPAIEALTLLLSFAEEINQSFIQLRPILLHFITDEIDDELDDFLYGMNLTMDLLCELTHRIGEKQQWSARANTAYVTLLELLSRDVLEVSCIYEDIDTPEYPISDLLKEAWSGTGHVEELKTLLVTSDLFMFRQVCYEVILSTDQWCPDINTLMDICGVDEEPEETEKPEIDESLAPTPEAALHILEKIHGDPLPRSALLACVLRRILPAHAIMDTSLSENLARVRNTLRNPLGMPSSSLVAISSSPEVPDDPDSLGLAGVGKTTLAAMAANHEDVRRFFNDGIAWIHVGETELNYTRYVQCLQDLVSQLKVEEDEEPHFPELLHTPGEPPGKRRRREEGFMIYLRETMVEFLRFRNVLVILDDVCFEPDLDWFDFAPGPMPDDQGEDEGSCAILVTSRRRDILPPADTVEVEMLELFEGVDLLIKESGELSNVISSDASVTKSVIVQCASHPLTVKSVARWLNLKHATTGDISNTEKMQQVVEKSMTKILNTELERDADMMYEVLNLSLSPSINGEPTSIIKFCFAAFVRVFCERKYISDFALADFSTIVPMSTTELLFESILDLEEEKLLREGSLFYTQKREAATVIPEALSALGVFKVITTYAEAPEESDEQEIEDDKYLQIMHRIQQEYGEYLYEEDASLTELMKDGEKRWNRAFAKAFLAKPVEWDTESPDASLDYALEMMPTHLIRGGMLHEAADLLCHNSFVRGRLFALGRESGTQRHIKDCEILYDLCIAERKNGRKIDAKGAMKEAYVTLGSFLSMEEDEIIREEGSLSAIEMGRSYFWIGFSLAEKRCWDAAIEHWENAQEYLVSALGIVELVAGILFNVGVAYAAMSEFEKSLGSLKQCLRIRGAIHGEEHILYAQTIQKIGDVFLAMSDYHEAMESYNWALDVMHIEPSHHRIDIGDVLENMGNIHYIKGAIEDSLQCHQDALRSKQVDLGEDHPELASSFHNIGNCLSSQGKTNEAIAHLEEAIRLKKLDPDGGHERDSDVLTIEGVLHNLNSRHDEGLACYEKALQILVTKVPHRKEKVASLLHLIGCVYLMSNEHKKAMKLFEESLQARRKVLGFVHLDVASTLFNMAFLYQKRNKLDKALKCLEEALKIRQLRLPDSEKVAVTYEKIGNLAKAIGKTKKAEIAFNEALRIRKIIHGDNHEAVATVLQELGDLMDDLGMYDAAMKHYVEALEIRENRLGPDDLAVAETYYSMGFTLQNNGGEDRAVQCLEESLSIRKFNLGDDAKEVGDTLNMLGYLQAQRGELNDALSLLWEALRIRKIQQDTVKVSETLNNIGNVHREKGEFEFAVECYEECLRIRRAELGDDNEKVADTLVALGNVFSDMDKKDESMDYYKEALMIRNVLFGEQDESVATVLQYMGTLEFRSNELDRAFQLLDEFVRIRQENGTEPDGDFVNALFMIGNIHKMQGYEDEARKCWKEAYGIFKELGLAQGNPQIAAVMRNLLDDEDFDRPEGGFVGFGNGPSVAGRNVFDMISEKVKSATRTASEAATAMKNAAGMQTDRGNQLL